MQSSKQIFISHSRKDHELMEVFRSFFNGTDIKPIFMEYESWSRKDEADWQWIFRHVKVSNAVWVIVTKNIVDPENPQTQNWVAYEIGVASACKPPKPVCVFKEEPVNFPVPYLNHYLPKVVWDKEAQWLSAKDKRMWEKHRLKVMQSMIKEPEDDTKTPKVRCKNCRIVFCYHGTAAQFTCPCCPATINYLEDKI